MNYKKPTNGELIIFLILMLLMLILGNKSSAQCPDYDSLYKKEYDLEVLDSMYRKSQCDYMEAQKNYTIYGFGYDDINCLKLRMNAIENRILYIGKNVKKI